MDFDPLTKEQIEDIFSKQDPSLIPLEYIIGIKLRTFDGHTRYFNGSDFRKFIEVNSSLVGYIEIAFNVKKFSDDVKEETKKAFLISE